MSPGGVRRPHGPISGGRPSGVARSHGTFSSAIVIVSRPVSGREIGFEPPPDQFRAELPGAVAPPDCVIERAAAEAIVPFVEFLQPIVTVAAEKAVDREAVGERDLPACARFCAIFQIDIGSGEIGRGLDQPHADQMALQLGRAIERAEGAEIAGARGWRGAPERQPGA